MKVADTFPYFSAKTPILVTEGVGKVLFDGDRNEMPAELEELDATRFEFMFHERKFWVAVEAQKSKEETKTTAEAKEEPYAKNCGNCAFFDHKTNKCRVTREEKDNPTRSICCAYAGYNGAIDVNDYNYQYQIVARNALLDSSGVGDVSEVACADCAFFNKERKSCFLCFSTNINETFGCGQGKKRSDYE